MVPRSSERQDLGKIQCPKTGMNSVISLAKVDVRVVVTGSRKYFANNIKRIVNLSKH